MAGEMGGEISKAVRVGGSEHRGDVDVLPFAGGAPQASEEHEAVGTVQPGDQAADAGGADLSRRGQLSAADPGGRLRAARGMDGRQSLSQYGSVARTHQTDNYDDDQMTFDRQRGELDGSLSALPRFTSWPHQDLKSNLLNLTHTTQTRLTE